MAALSRVADAPSFFWACAIPCVKTAGRFVDIVKWAMRGSLASDGVEIRYRLSGNPLKLKQS
jgi:hypothetical protein